MSASRQTTLWCDGVRDYCADWIQFTGNLASARKEAKAVGWRYNNRKNGDRCPHCVKRADSNRRAGAS